jgi:hypothetical protein
LPVQTNTWTGVAAESLFDSYVMISMKICTSDETFAGSDSSDRRVKKLEWG